MPAKEWKVWSGSKSGGSACDLNDEQIKSFVDWVDETHPTTRRIVGAWLKQMFDVSYSKAGTDRPLEPCRAGLPQAGARPARH